MIHWFHVGRDLMWFSIVFLPIFLSSVSMYYSANANKIRERDGWYDPITEVLCMCGAIAIQTILIMGFWKGFIK